MSATRPATVADLLGVAAAGGLDTFDEFATVDLARSNFKGYDMVLGRSC